MAGSGPLSRSGGKVGTGGAADSAISAPAGALFDALEFPRRKAGRNEANTPPPDTAEGARVGAGVVTVAGSAGPSVDVEALFSISFSSVAGGVVVMRSKDVYAAKIPYSQSLDHPC